MRLVAVMDSKSMIAGAIRSVEVILRLVADLQPNGAKCNELGEKVRNLSDTCRPFAVRTNEVLDACQSGPTLSKLQSLLISIVKFLQTVPSLIAEGMNEELDVMMSGFNKKIDAIMGEIGQLEDRLAALDGASGKRGKEPERAPLPPPPPPPSLEQQFVEDPPREDADDDRSVISHGAFGATHQMSNTVDRQAYAVKRLRMASLISRGATSAVLMKDCEILKRLAHPHIVRYTAAFLSKGDRFFNIATELIKGGRSLAEKITCSLAEAPAEAEIVAWARQIASALSYMHGEGVLHRDLKPENVMLTESNTVMIVGLKLACLSSSAGELTVYSSHERASGMPFDRRDDVWAVGCILLELLTRARVPLAISHPDNKEVSQRRSLLLSAAAAASPRLGGEILPHLLSPLV